MPAAQTAESKAGADVATSVHLTIDGREFTVELADTPAAQEFADRLPLELTLDELNGNEKFVYLDEPLSAAPEKVGTIHCGDVMLYGDGCLVVFYDTFATNYQYTRIGTVAEADALPAAVGESHVDATFEPL